MESVATEVEVAAPAVRPRCADMDRLRAEAKQLQEKLRLTRQHARAHQQQDRREGPRANHSNDFELFLQRKMLKNALRMAQHIAQHQCEELGSRR